MGCLFGKQEQAQNRYQMNEYDKFKVLQLIQSIEEMFLIFNLQGAWNYWIYMKCSGNLLQLLSNLISYDLGQVHQDPTILAQLFPINKKNFTYCLANLPKSLFYQIIQVDDEFLKKNMINKDEIFDEEYSCFDESDIELEQEPEIDLANQSLDLSGIDNNIQNQSPVKKANFDDKINHKRLIDDYVEHFCPQSTEILYEWMQKSNVITYLQTSLLIDFWFEKKKFEEKYLWEKTTSNQFVKRKFQLIGTKLFILYLVDTFDIVEIFPLNLTQMEEIPKEQYVNKFGLTFKCDRMKIKYQLYFDTLEELHYVNFPYTQKYSILKQDKQKIECLNKNLGQKLSIQQYQFEQINIQSLLIHESVSNFRGVIKCHEIQFFGNKIFQVCDNIPYTLNEFMDQVKTLNEFQIRLIAKQLLVIFDYFHTMGLIVVCLNPNQIGVIPNKQELDSVEKIVILNFSYSTYTFQQYKNQNLSDFSAIEVIKNNIFDETVDSYLIFKLISYIKKDLQLSPKFQDFLKKMEQRLPISKALQHEVFKDETITKKAIENMMILKD